MNTSPRAVISVQPPRILYILSATISISLLLLAALFLSGCTTTPTDHAAKTLAATVQTVDAAMQGYGLAVALNRVSTSDQAQVRQLYENYQAAVELSELAITHALKSGDNSRLETARGFLDEAREPLLLFLARFTTSPPKP